ncbi:hypothetical protein J6590_036432 [Homalodisca vitripennis]|nr:hypothetical protein J6590_036432 [Homalodisca vitripennis]
MASQGLQELCNTIVTEERYRTYRRRAGRRGVIVYLDSDLATQQSILPPTAQLIHVTLLVTQYSAVLPCLSGCQVSTVSVIPHRGTPDAEVTGLARPCAVATSIPSTGSNARTYNPLCFLPLYVLKLLVDGSEDIKRQMMQNHWSEAPFLYC